MAPAGPFVYKKLFGKRIGVDRADPPYCTCMVVYPRQLAPNPRQTKAMAPLPGLKEGGRFLPRPRSTRTNPSRLGLAHGRWRRREKSWLSVVSTLAIGFVWLTLPLRAQFAYVTNQGGGVSAYSIGADGSLTQLPGSPFPAGNYPQSVAVDPTGKFAYVANGDSSNVSAYSIGADGSLTQLTTSPFAAGSHPGSVAITPLPFASSFAKLGIATDSFNLKETFALGANGNFNPATENVTLQIANFSVTIPVGSFQLNPDRSFAFTGFINGVYLQARIVPLDNNTFRLTAVGKGVNLPFTVGLTVGQNTGTTTFTTPPFK